MLSGYPGMGSAGEGAPGGLWDAAVVLCFGLGAHYMDVIRL